MKKIDSSLSLKTLFSLADEYKAKGNINQAISVIKGMINSNPTLTTAYHSLFEFLLDIERFDQIIPEAKRILQKIADYDRKGLIPVGKDAIPGSMAPKMLVYIIQRLMLTKVGKYIREHAYSKAKNLSRQGIETFSLCSPLFDEELKRNQFEGLYLYCRGSEIFEANPYKAFFLLYKSSKLLDKTELSIENGRLYVDVVKIPNTTTEKTFDLDFFAERIPLYEEEHAEPDMQTLKIVEEARKDILASIENLMGKIKADRRLNIAGKMPEYEMWDIKGNRPSSKKMVEDLRKRNKKGRINIFIDEDGTAYFRGNKVAELKKSQILYDFLVYFLKNKGVGGTYRELFINVWKRGEVSAGFAMDSYKKGRVIRMKNRLNTLFKKYGTEEMNYEYNKYSLAEDCDFYLIEKCIYEGHNQNL